jgi:hypothetical protein
MVSLASASVRLIFQSGTRREELLISEEDLHKISVIRRGLAGHKPIEAFLPINPRRDVWWQGIGWRGFLLEQRLARFRWRFSIHPRKATGEIKRILKTTTLGDFLDCQTRSAQQGHGKLEFEKAESLHRRMAERGLEDPAEVLFRDSGAFGQLAELQGVMRIRVEDAPHEIQ